MSPLMMNGISCNAITRFKRDTDAGETLERAVDEGKKCKECCDMFVNTPVRLEGLSHNLLFLLSILLHEFTAYDRDSSFILS